MLMVILALLLRRRPIHTAVIYLHGAAGKAFELDASSLLLDTRRQKQNE